LLVTTKKTSTTSTRVTSTMRISRRKMTEKNGAGMEIGVEIGGQVVVQAVVRTEDPDEGQVRDLDEEFKVTLRILGGLVAEVAEVIAELIVEAEAILGARQRGVVEWVVAARVEAREQGQGSSRRSVQMAENLEDRVRFARVDLRRGLRRV
jgi:hypothetical protein